MATISSKQIVDDIIAADGYYGEGPTPLAIYEYTGFAGQTLYSLCYSSQDIAALYVSPDAHNIKCLWQKWKG